MGKFGDAAVMAVQLILKGDAHFPDDAWYEATGRIFGEGSASRSKSCPKGAFLGLCEEGYVKGIPKGSYTESFHNKEYALRALTFLRENNDLCNDKKRLWKLVTEEDGTNHNQQMDVVCVLWKQGLVVKA